MDPNGDIVRTYDHVADEYVREFRDELDGKPSDRLLLERFAKEVPEGQRVCDLGCGPGQVGAFVARSGVDVLGIDLSPEMVRVGRETYPALDFRVGDMLDLDLPEASLGGIVAFYSIIHIARDRIDRAFAEMFRVLTGSGKLLIAFHQGEGTLESGEWFGKPVTYRCNLFEPRDITASMERAGFLLEEVVQRSPYEDEYPSERVYILAMKPGQSGGQAARPSSRRSSSATCRRGVTKTSSR